MLLDEGVLQPHSLAKYATAFFKMPRSSGTRLSSARSLRIIVLLTQLLELVELDPGVKAVYGHAQALGNISNRFALLGHLLDRFDFEFFGVTLTTYGTYWGLIMRLEGI